MKRRSKNQWFLTYSDMVTLLLVFFVIFLSITKPDPVTSKMILSSFTGNLSLLKSGSSFQEVHESFVTLGNVVQSLPATEVTKQKLSRDDQPSVFLFDNLQDTRKVRVIENREGVVVSLFTDIFFEPGSDKMDYDSVKDVLENIRKLIDDYNFKGEILINGHTDNTPYSDTKFRNNWELSMARSLQVFNALRQIPFVYPLDTTRVSVHAYGENQPIESNSTPEGRAYNRRVDIVLKR